MSKPKIQRGDSDVIRCARCGEEIYRGEAYHTYWGDMCEICYGDLYY